MTVDQVFVILGLVLQVSLVLFLSGAFPLVLSLAVGEVA
jgi:hypothetical protein